jgi:rhamnose utilization protein RhaD (predicted bifunctional aldolase and dehydrogenase)
MTTEEMKEKQAELMDRMQARLLAEIATGSDCGKFSEADKKDMFMLELLQRSIHRN